MSTESAEQPKNSGGTADRIPRREALKIAGALLLMGLPALPERSQTKRAKKVIVAGAGIAGLSCAYELMRRGHDVTVRSEEHTSELQSQSNIVCRLLLEKKNI